MLKIDTLALGDYQTNCYIIRQAGSKTCCVIDPGYEPDRVLSKAEQLGLEIEAILLTHGHFDHVGGVKTIAAETACRVFLCSQELSLPPMLTAGKLFYTDTYDEGDTLSLAGLTISVLRTPGHTPGSVCLLVNDVMFSGDTLFRDSCGRTDFEGGDMATILKSLLRLSNLEGDYEVYPGHMGSTTLSRERSFNYYMNYARNN